MLLICYFLSVVEAEDYACNAKQVFRVEGSISLQFITGL